MWKRVGSAALTSISICFLVLCICFVLQLAGRAWTGRLLALLLVAVALLLFLLLHSLPEGRERGPI